MQGFVTLSRGTKQTFCTCVHDPCCSIFIWFKMSFGSLPLHGGLCAKHPLQSVGAADFVREAMMLNNTKLNDVEPLRTQRTWSCVLLVTMTSWAKQSGNIVE